MDSATLFPWYGPLIWPLVAIVGFAIHAVIRRQALNTVEGLKIFLLWWFAFVVGVTALVAFASIMVFPEQIAERIGYRTSGFEYEVASANLAFAVLGFLCLRYRGQLWEATTVGVSVFLFGAAVGHIYHFVAFGNTQPYNIGPILYTDILGQVVLIVALIAYRRATRHDAASDHARTRELAR